VGRAVEVTDAEVTVRLSGWAALAALRRQLRIPLGAIVSVSTERYAHDGFRLGGTAIPFTGIRAGRFRRDGLKTFLSFEDRDRVLTLRLDRGVPGVDYDVVAVGAADPVALAEAIERRRALRRLH
jgi:hypothetical protein